MAQEPSIHTYIQLKAKARVHVQCSRFYYGVFLVRLNMFRTCSIYKPQINKEELRFFLIANNYVYLFSDRERVLARRRKFESSQVTNLKTKKLLRFYNE